jgi:two-component system sensor histidine kinase KdpD
MTIFKKNYKNILGYALILVMMIAAATGIGWIFRMIGFPETNIVIVYLLSVLMTARLTRGYVYGIIASMIATCAFNYFFTRPYYTLSVNDPSYLITFSIMTITAFITSALTSKVKQNALEAQGKEEETSALFQLTNRLTDAADIPDIAGITTETISGIINCRAACLCFDEKGQPERNFIQQQSIGKQVRRKVDNASEIKHRIEGLRIAYDAGEEFYDWPIYGREAILGVMRIPKETAVSMSEPQKRLLRSMIESAALAMDRFRSAQDQQKSREETEQERYRGNLLRAISHDLRTPLTGIMGTAEILMGMTGRTDPRYALAQGINKDADWLHSLVENILSLTRLQDGKLTITKQPEAVEEVIGGAVSHMMKRYPEYEIMVSIPEDVLIVPMDAKLIEQVLINLFDNAVKHSTLDCEIGISVREERNMAVFSITDHGNGIALSDLPNIFQMFYTTASGEADARRGVGLGLTICEAIIKAHGGVIEGHNRIDGQGAEFTFTLPMEVAHHGEQE